MKHPLIAAVKAADVDSVERLLRLGADPNMRTAGGWPVLAMARGRTVPLLLRHGADLGC